MEDVMVSITTKSFHATPMNPLSANASVKISFFVEAFMNMFVWRIPLRRLMLDFYSSIRYAINYRAKSPEIASRTFRSNAS